MTFAPPRTSGQGAQPVRANEAGQGQLRPGDAGQGQLRPGDAGQGQLRPGDAGQGAWKTLASGASAAEASTGWAAIMRDQLERLQGSGVRAVFVFRYDIPSDRLYPLAAAPAQRVASELAVETCDAAIKAGRPTARGSLPGNPGHVTGEVMVAAQPILIDGETHGVACAEMVPQGASEMRLALRQLQWGAAGLRDSFRQDAQSAQSERYAAAVEALNSIVKVAERRDFTAAAAAAVTDLATRFNCDRVTLGFRRRKRTTVRAISHSAQFSRRMQMIRLLSAAMDEAIDQRAAVLWSATEEEDGDFATRAAETLGRHTQASHVYTVPLFVVDAFVGALVFERPESEPFTGTDLDMLEAVVTVLAPVLDEKRRVDRWVIFVVWDALVNQFKRLAGPSHLTRKLVAAALVAMTAFFSVAKGEYQVSAEARVVGTVERAITPAFDGFVAAAPVSAGDFVKEGDLLVQLDDRDLTLERLRLATQRDQQRIEFEKAVSARDRAEMNIRQSQINQAEAEIALVDKQLERTRLLAPFDGLVVSGDLSQSIGSSVRRGDALLLVAPADSYRVTLQVDERQIADVSIGQPGALRVTALPNQTFPVEVEKLTPVARYSEGATTFEVDAVLTTQTPLLRPGMDGVARISVEERSLISIWTKPIVDWLRVTAWRLFAFG